MEAVLDAIARMLAASTTANPVGSPAPNIVTWIVGDVGMGPVENLPFGYIAPLNDAVVPGQSTAGPNGYDMDIYTVPMLIVFDELQTKDPVTVVGESFYEQPGYRDLMRLGQNIRATVRDNIILGGLVATSTVAEMKYVLSRVNDKTYRALRITLQLRQRRSR